MNVRTSEAIRANARFYGIAFHCLAILTLCATIFATFKIASLGDQLGVQPANDPAPWLIFVFGIFISLLLTGFGTVLGMLCAIYDRQEAVRQSTAPRTIATSDSSIAATESDRAVAPPTKPAIHESYRIAQPRTSESQIASPSSAPSASASSKKNGLWEQLTKERHLFNDEK